MSQLLKLRNKRMPGLTAQNSGHETEANALELAMDEYLMCSYACVIDRKDAKLAMSPSNSYKINFFWVD